MFKERPVAPTTKARGDAAEDRALAWLRARGLMLVERNYRVARGPRARGGIYDQAWPVMFDPKSGACARTDR